MRQRTISDYFWCDPKLSGLSQEDKATLLFFLTSPESNIIGVYQVVWGIAASEMGWTKDQLLVVSNRLMEKGLIKYNEDGWIFVKIWWEHNSAAGAFSPKLIQNAKKQCDAMPAEWVDEFVDKVDSLKLSGLNRLSIGYEYPIDTPPPNTTTTTCIPISITTTTNTQNNESSNTIGEKLIYPSLTEEEIDVINIILQSIPHAQQKRKQELLDELAGAMSSNSIRKGRVPLFRKLVAEEKNGKFMPSSGVKILADRNSTRRKKNEESAEKNQRSSMPNSVKQVLTRQH
jgi:hypothetical protein